MIRKLRRRFFRVMGKLLEGGSSSTTDSDALLDKSSGESKKTNSENEAGNLTEMMNNILMGFIQKFWKICSTFGLFILLCYWYYGSLIALLLLSFTAVGALYKLQDMLVYCPDQPPNARLYVESPLRYGLEHENTFVKTKDGVKINMVFIKQSASQIGSVPTVIFFHGNAGNVGHRMVNSLALHSQCNVNILLVEYRGFGKSCGEPSETGFYLDAEAAMNYISTRTDIDQRQLIVFGRSLGGAVSSYLACHPTYAPRIMCLMLENTFTSLPAIGKCLFNFKFITVLPHWAFKNQYPTRDRLMRVSVPTLFLSGLSDDLIPPAMMRNLYDVCGSPVKRMSTFDSGTHNETWQCEGYYTAISRFIEEVKARKGITRPRASFHDAPFNDHGRPAFSH